MHHPICLCLHGKEEEEEDDGDNNNNNISVYDERIP